ncbi:hypothetical protein HJA76_09765 [Rhizobium bangladeshense]|uniref:hypothetical protein n=1 Tax=Rhizobium bangladeshense TaxID=1138189 RepID=UPI001C830EB3|nr:hypothetical protein [Rhizobium bangladeshense]MBX4919994.1 hypothetical protein [Rhizobium bangladeshense]
MEKRHEAEFLNRLERVWTIGVSEIHRAEIKLWFGNERIAKRTWRQIADYWTEIVEDESVEKLLVAGTNNDVWIFAWGERQPTTIDSYFQDVRHLAGRTSADGQPLGILSQVDDGEED